MEQQLTMRRNSDTQAGVRFWLPQVYDQWLPIWQSEGGDAAISLTFQLGVASQTQVVYSPVRLLLREKAEALGALQERRIRKLQNALIEERIGKSKSKEAVLRSCFSLYKEELMSMSEVMQRAGMNRWEFFAYLDGNPEYQQVNIDDFLERVKED